MNTTPYLHLESIKTDHQLTKLLPQEVAHRYHALPVATDGNRVTIAMASPEDKTASEAVASAIEAPICLVQADPKEIDQHLAEIWPKNPAIRLRLLVWTPTAEFDPTLLLYAQGIADLLQADLKQVSFAWSGVKNFEALARAAYGITPDLIIFQIKESPLIKRMLVNFATQKLIDRLPASVIIPQNPRWSLEKILVVLPNGGPANESAIDWAIQFARSNHIAVTVLPLVPPVPGMYGSLIQHSIQSLLTAKDPLGQKMRSIVQRFSVDDIKGTFKLREGEPLDQLRQEMLADDPDLVIIAADRHDCLLRRVAEELVSPLLAWANRPVLISNKIKMEKH